MKAVGLRELKNRLSEYVRLVRAGEEILITDRGEVVAELRAPRKLAEEREVPTWLADLARKGLVRLASKPNKSVGYPILPRIGKRSSAELLDEERGDH